MLNTDRSNRTVYSPRARQAALALLLVLTTACAGNPPAAPATAPSAIPEEPSPPSRPLGTGRPGLPGLYTTHEVLFSDENGAWEMVAGTDCEDLLAMLAAGEWSMRGPAQVPGLMGMVYHAWLDRGDEQLYVQASGSGPGLMALAGSLSEATPSPGHSPTASTDEGELPESLPVSRDCTAVLQPVSRQSLRLTGNEQYQGDVSVTAKVCTVVEGNALLHLLVEGEDDLRAMIDLRTLATLGEHPVDAFDEQMQVAVGRSPQTFVAYYQWMGDLFARALAGDDLAEADEQARPGAAYYPGDQFSGSVRVANMRPFTGEITLSGMVSEEGEVLSVELGYVCSLGGVNNGSTQAVHEESPGATVSVDLTYDKSMDVWGVPIINRGAVRLAGDLLHSGPFRYSGSLVVEGQGEFSDFDGDGKPCEGAWSGSEQVLVSGRVNGEELDLTFSPHGVGQVEYASDCLPQEAEPGRLPHRTPLLQGEGTLSIAWPPEAVGANKQEIDNGFAADWVELWRVSLLPLR